MKENEIYGMFADVERKIRNLSQNKKKEENEIISLRLQMNALIRVIKIFLPIKWLFKFYHNLEFKKYSRELMRNRRNLIKMQEAIKKQQEENKKKVADEKKAKIGRNKPCPCGSGKKYKKCCINKEAEKNEDDKNKQSDNKS